MPTATAINGKRIVDGINPECATLQMEKTRVQQAMEFLVVSLSEGPKPVAVVTAEAKNHGLSARSLQRARKEVGVVSVRSGFGKDGVWSLRLPPERVARAPRTTFVGAVTTPLRGFRLRGPSIPLPGFGPRSLSGRVGPIQRLGALK
jgi:hypothetical protein